MLLGEGRCFGMRQHRDRLNEELRKWPINRRELDVYYRMAEDYYMLQRIGQKVHHCKNRF